MKRNLPALLFLMTLTALLITAFGGLTWANLRWMAALPQESEFLHRWEITRSLVFKQANPYAPLDGYQFTAPLPILALYFPVALVKDYTLARALWVTLNQITVLVFTYLGMRNASWKANRWATAAILLFALLWLPSVSIYRGGSTAIVMAAFFGGGILLLQKGKNEIAGVLLALSALQWTLTWPGVLLTLLWAASQRRWVFYFWGAVTFVIASALGMIFIPSWPVDFFWATLRYINFHIGQAVLNITTGWWPGIGRQIGWGIIIFGGILLMVEWWLVWGRDSRHLTWTIALTWIISIWIGLEVGTENIFLLLCPLIITFAAWNLRWGAVGLFVDLGALVLLLIGLWWSALLTGAGIDNPFLALGLPLLALIGLYWARWWYLRSAYFEIEA